MRPEDRKLFPVEQVGGLRFNLGTGTLAPESGGTGIFFKGNGHRPKVASIFFEGGGRGRGVSFRVPRIRAQM